MTPARAPPKTRRRTAPRTILLLTDAGCSSMASRVDAAVEGLGHDAVLVDTDSLLADGALTVMAGPQGVRALLDVGTLELDLSSIFAIGCPSLSTVVHDVEPPLAHHAFAGTLALLEDVGVRFVNPPGAQRRAAHRAVQLQAALSAGLSVPPLLVTNDPVAMSAFVEENDGEGRGARALDGVIVTRLVAESHTVGGAPFSDVRSRDLGYSRLAKPGRLSGGDCVGEANCFPPGGRRSAPMILRKDVDHVIEVRAVVVGKNVFATSAPPGSLDGPLGSNERWQVHRLPRAIERSCVRLVADLGLVTGTVDVLVDAEGIHWFLEIHGSGAWGSLPSAIELLVAEAIARALVGRTSRASPSRS